MTNAELVAKISSSVIHPSEATNVKDMLAALKEYLRAVPGKKNDLPTFKRIPSRDQHIIVILANAIWNDGYVPSPLTESDKDCFHPEREPWLDHIPHYREDYIVYLDFLEQAVATLAGVKSNERGLTVVQL